MIEKNFEDHRAAVLERAFAMTGLRGEPITDCMTFAELHARYWKALAEYGRHPDRNRIAEVLGVPPETIGTLDALALLWPLGFDVAVRVMYPETEGGRLN